MNDEILYTIALSNLQKINSVNSKLLYDRMGSATAVWENRHSIRDILPDATDRLCEAMKGMEESVKRAEIEMEFIQKKHVKALCLNDEDYPARLRECPDTPLVLFSLGNAELNSRHIISVVGTRKCSQYGRELCQQLISGIRQQCPDTLIVSGLAYGIDINAHRAALANELPTVGVLAHGLDRIYPAMHRTTAVQMLEQGGLLSEYISGTTPERVNFVRRNRIVAGMSDATVVIESATKGGSLITADMANEYHKEVYTFPGRVTDEYSAGCNRLIAEQKATLVSSAEDILNNLGWITHNSPSKAVQQDLFPSLSDEQQLIVESLKNSDGKQINQIVVETNLTYMQVSNQLYELECMGIVALLGGARYKLIRPC